MQLQRAHRRHAARDGRARAAGGMVRVADGERQAARANKDFATADRIRDELAAQGIKLLDTKEGVRWTRD